MLNKIGLGGFLSFETGIAEAAMGRAHRLFGRLSGAAAQNAAATNSMSGAYRDASGRLRDVNGKFVSVANAMQATNGATAGTTGQMRNANGQFAKVGQSAQAASQRVNLLQKSIMGLRGTGGTISQVAAQITGLGRSIGKSIGDSAGALGNFGAQLAMTGAALSPLSMGLRKAMTDYNAFNKQMSAVQAVGLMNQEQFNAMRELAIQLGSATKFTAIEAAQGMEELVRAGYSVEEAMAAARPMLDLAAADNMALGEAAMWSANIIRGLGLSAKDDSARVADVLALTSASSNASVTSLGEAFKMSVSTSALLNISLEETAAVLGKMSDAGLKGTAGGTAFNNMMNKLVKPSKTAAAWLKQNNIELTDASGKFRKVGAITNDLGAALAKIPDEAERTAIGFELTGLRGVKALNALMMAGKGGSSSVAELEAQLMKAGGTAQRMASIQLNNMAGQITILESSIEGFTIRLFDMFKGLDGSAIAPLVNAMGALNAAWDDIKNAMEGGLTSKEQAAIEEKHGTTMVAIVLGIRDGVDTLRSALKAVSEWFANVGKRAEESLGPNAIRIFTKMGVVIAGIAAIGAPLLLFLGSMAFIIGNVIMPLFRSMAVMASAAFWPIVIAVGVVVVAFAALRKEGESLSEFLNRMWTAIKEGAVRAWENGIKPFWEGVKEGWKHVFPVLKVVVTEVFDAIKNLVQTLIDLWVSLGGSVGEGTTDWKAFGETAVLWLGKIVSGIGHIVTFVIDVIESLVSILSPVIVVIKDIIMSIWEVLQPLWEGIKQGWTEVWPTLKVVALEVFAAIMEVIDVLVELWYDLTDAVGGGSFNWQEFGRIAVQVVAFIAIAFGKLLKFFIGAIKWIVQIVADAIRIVVSIFKALWGFWKRTISFITQLFGGLIEAFKMIANGDVIGALKTAGMALLNFLLSPLRLIIGAIADMVDSLLNMRAVKKLIPDSTLEGMRDFVGGMREFADKGITLKDMEPTTTGGPPKALGVDFSKLGQGGGDDSEFLDLGASGIAGFGSDQLAKLQGEKAAFEAQQEKETNEEMAKRMAAETSAAVREGMEDASLETTVNSSVCMDGKEVARNQAKHQQDLADRLGAKTPPFVRRTAAEQGTIPPR